MTLFRAVLVFVAAVCSLCAYGADFTRELEYFLTTEDKHERLEKYHSLEKAEDKIKFAFEALDALSGDPQRPSLKFLWKAGRVSQFLDSLDPDVIPLEYVPVLFKALKVGMSPVLEGDLLLIDCLQKICGYNPGYDFDYICQNKYDEVARMALIGEWENWFALNKVKILKKKECKKMNWGKNVAL